MRVYWERHNTHLALHAIVGERPALNGVGVGVGGLPGAGGGHGLDPGFLSGADSMEMDVQGSGPLRTGVLLDYQGCWQRLVEVLKGEQGGDVAAVLALLPSEEIDRAVQLLQPGGELAEEVGGPEIAANLDLLLQGGREVSTSEERGSLQRLVSAIERLAGGAPPDNVDAEGLVNGSEAYQQAQRGTSGRRGRTWSYWSAEEKHALITAYSEHGRDWAQMQAAVPTKTMTQIRNFYQNYKAKHFDIIQLPPSAVLPGSRKRKAVTVAPVPPPLSRL